MTIRARGTDRREATCCQWVRFAILAPRPRRRHNRHSLPVGSFRNWLSPTEQAAQPA